MRVVDERTTGETARTVAKGLSAYNTAKAGPPRYKRFAVSVRDERNAIRGGIVGYTVWNWCFVEMLWLDEAARSGGLGTELLQRAENRAVRMGARHVFLDTFSFQGDGFYQRLGYEVFGELTDFPPGERRIWLKKDLP